MPKPDLVKAGNFLDQIEFDNDFGQEPIGVGRFTEDKAVVGVFSLAIAFVSWAITPPLAVIVALVAWNDLKSIDGGSSSERKERSPTVDTTAEEVYEDEDYEDNSNWHVDLSDSNFVDTANRKKASQDEPRTESGKTPLLPQVTNRAKQELIQRLKEECPALLRLIKSHPIRAVGMQRTGKSTLIKKLALLRMILLPGHQVIASTPHYEPANPYPDAFNVVGITPEGKRDYPSIRREWFALASRVEDCCINSITTIWDEFGLQDKVIDEEEIKSVLTSCLRETMKFGEYPVFIVHGETTAFLPGSKGLVTVFLNGTVRVETIGESIEGDDGLEMIRPTGRFNITWLDGSKEPGQIPEWLTELYLLELLGNPVRVTEKKPQKEDNEFTVSAGLKEPLRTLLQKTKEHRDWITVGEVQKREWKNVKGNSAEKIHQHLGLLADMKLGEIDEINKSHSAVRFKAL